jgi:hypothetical protein
MTQSSGNNQLLDDIEALQDQVLLELAALNQQIEGILKCQLTAEAAEEKPCETNTVGKEPPLARVNLPMVILPSYFAVAQS